MALINCPECGKEISDKVKACPNCGYPLIEEAEEPQKVSVTSIDLKKITQKQKKKILLIAIIIFAIVVTVSIFAVINKNNYAKQLQAVSSAMVIQASNAEEIANLTGKVWYNSIYKESDPETNKYTIKKDYYKSYDEDYDYSSKYDFEEDFNNALYNLSLDKEYLEKEKIIKDGTEEIKVMMKKLNNPTAEFKSSYETTTELYTAYQSLVDLAINPSGNLTSFNSNKSDKIDKFKTAYSKLQTQIPNMPKENKKIKNKVK